jgi:nucleoid-associated protein YgaU
MAGWVKAILFLLGGGAAAAGTAYVTGMLDPWLAPKPAEISTVLPTPDAAPQEQDATPAEAAAEQDAEEEAGPATTPKQERLSAPVFDVLRVEPDGSVLVAGKAGGDAMVEVLSGDTVLGKAAAGASGDFVVMLDERLSPGDYRLALRATAPGGAAVVSDSAAIVSVPETTDGQVLAMVEEPGAPAQLIAVPQPAAEPAPAAVEETAEEDAGEAAQPQIAAAEEQQPAAAEQPAGETQPATAEAEEEAAPQPAPEPVSQPAPQPASAAHTVSVEAVEIEGGTIFVAGRADPGRTVRVYAGTVLLGDAVASEGGRFLVEAKRHLDVGSHLIRADLLGDDGSVVARAGVPFEREPGEAIAAVAPQGTAAQGTGGLGTGGQEPATTAPAGQETAAQQPAAEIAATVDQPAGPAADGEEGEATAAPLQRVDGAVIIRRGDSLWRISRRVYGHGIRYSTIYLANQDQIQNPDRIWPGQVFTVPDRTPEGEEADLDAVGDQAVTPQEREAASD